MPWPWQVAGRGLAGRGRLAGRVWPGGRGRPLAVAGWPGGRGRAVAVAGLAGN